MTALPFPAVAIGAFGRGDESCVRLLLRRLFSLRRPVAPVRNEEADPQTDQNQSRSPLRSVWFNGYSVAGSGSDFVRAKMRSRPIPPGVLAQLEQCGSSSLRVE
jgi:hypothetical protein